MSNPETGIAKSCPGVYGLGAWSFAHVNIEKTAAVAVTIDGQKTELFVDVDSLLLFLESIKWQGRLGM